MPSPIEFCLFAPRLERAILTGSFCSWQDIEMRKDDTTGEFCVSIDLADGEYAYKFRVPSREKPDTLVHVIDPYATKVDEDEKGAILKINKGKRVNGEEYIWKHDDQKLPQNRDLILYEIFIADFTEEGTLSSATSKLDYLAHDLGVNAVEIMPVQACLNDHDWGYGTRHFFAVEPSYGPSQDLKHFVDECHSRGIRVMLDFVFNHSHTECPLTKIDRTYWFYEGFHHPDHPEENWGPEFNYDFEDEQRGKMKPALKYIEDVIRFWIQEYHIDGIRFDAAKQIDSHDVLRHFDSIGQSLRSPFYSVAEFVPATYEIVKPQGPMDAVWRLIVFPFQAHLQSPDDLSHIEKLVEMGQPANEEKFPCATSMINYWACHDNENLMHLLGQNGYLDEEAFKRLKLAAVWLMIGMGVPQIWMGDEWGAVKAFDSEDRTKTIHKLDWSLLLNTSNHSLLDLYHKLISLRKSSSAVKSDNIDFFHRDFDARIIAYSRCLKEMGDRVVALFNISTKDQVNYRVTHWPKEGRWQELISGHEVRTATNELQVDLTAYEAKVFVYKE